MDVEAWAHLQAAPAEAVTQPVPFQVLLTLNWVANLTALDFQRAFKGPSKCYFAPKDVRSPLGFF